MNISEIKIKRVIPEKGLVGFASCSLDESLHIGNIAIFSRLGQPDSYRLVFPVKEVGTNKIPIIKPLKSDLYYQLEAAIAEAFKQND
jgi:DNA-binding cell septation regulator SpoVG